MRLPESRPLRFVLFALVALVIVIAGWLGWSSWQHHQRLRAPIPATLLDIAPIRLARPDAMIVSSSLRDLPHDLLSVPLLKSVLTEDFVFYYEERDTVLGLKGTLRRIAYEHQLSLGDEVIALALEQPADVALWRGPDGKLTHWLLNANRNGWAKLLELAAKVAVSDTQLSQAGTLPLAGGGTTPLYKLQYTSQDALFFAGNGDKMVVFSDPSMIEGNEYGTDAERAKVWQALLDTHWQASPLRRHFGLADFTGKHTVVAETGYLSFNYQQFFPAFEALRFDFDGQGWSSYVRLRGGAPRASLATQDLWHHVPTAASLCTAMPLEPAKLAPILAGTKDLEPLGDPKMLDGVHAPVAICWYPSGGLYSPLVVAHVDAHAASDADLDALFDKSIGNSFAAQANGGDAAAAGDADRTDAGKQGGKIGGNQASRTATHTAGNGNGADGVDAHSQNGARIWHRMVKTDFGRFDVTMAREGDWLVFSPNAQLVTDTLAVFTNQRPALADSLPNDRSLIETVITPRTLSALLEQAALGSLPQQTEPIFREAAQNRLVPRLKALAGFPPVALILPESLQDAQRAWQPIEWQTLSDAK
jgi:uncharacterized protein YfaA (DUF2138 family)